MKKLNNFINEKLKLNRNTRLYEYTPENKSELKDIIKQIINKEGNTADLNDIDVSKITNMDDLFISFDFAGDVSCWKVSNVTSMKNMFDWCENFNCDLSDWDVSNVTNMNGMFVGCKKFDCDLSNWNVDNVKNFDIDNIFGFSKIKRISEHLPKQKRKSL